MRKFIFAICVVVGFCANGLAWEEYKFHYGYDMECVIDENRDVHKAWFCGEQSRSCRSIKPKGSGWDWYWYYDCSKTGEGNKQEPSANNEGGNHCRLYHHDRKFVCCNGTRATSGKFVIYDEWRRDDTKKIGGGTCQRVVDPCGHPIEDCFFPEKCTDPGTKIRVVYEDNLEKNAFDRRCVAPCVFPNGYENIFSDTCVDCKTTKNSGVDSFGVCITCDNDEFFVRGEEGCAGRNGGHFSDGGSNEQTYAGCCVKKNKQEIANKSTFKECFRCVLQPSIWLSCMRGKLGETTEGLTACGLKQEIDPEYRTQKAAD